MSDILEALINASERAACIARSCCSESAHGSLLVAEKCEGEANTRFERDFKTIADVLAQESARTEVELRCPDLAKHFRGEECAEISGVPINLQENTTKTAELLSLLVSEQAAQKMAEAAHCELNVSVDDVPKDLPKLNATELGVWIDPIDATTEFISGVKGEANAGCGLPCVTVLIGAYNMSTGEPVVGVINQPFYNKGQGRIIWGVSYGNTNKYGGVEQINTEAKTVLLSGAEKPDIANKFREAGWEVKSVPGAGHKLLIVALGEAAAYIVSKGSTFRWDTCAPNAILKAMGGNLLCYTSLQPITYNNPLDVDTQQHANSGGIIAFTQYTVFDKIKSILY